LLAARPELWLLDGCSEKHTDSDLARVAAAWPDLPPHIRAAVLALIQSAG
jgi:hypothetical protein